MTEKKPNLADPDFEPTDERAAGVTPGAARGVSIRAASAPPPPGTPDGMGLALGEAEAAGERGEVPVGAVIVAEGVVLAAAGNRRRELFDPTAHAEMLAIRDACARARTDTLTGADLYTTLEPCPMCAGAISFARIRRVYYGAADPKGGGVDHGPRVFSHPTCHHRPEVYGGIRELEAGELLKRFFVERR